MSTRLEDGLAALCKEFRLVAIYAFGSRATEVAARARGGSPGATKLTSDVDIGVEPRRDRRLDARARVVLMQRLEALLDAARVDLVILPEADAFLAADVVRGELLAASDLDGEAEAQLYYLRRAADLAPFLRERWHDVVGSRL